jgi:hypothetical protein
MQRCAIVENGNVVEKASAVFARFDVFLLAFWRV